MPSTRLKTILFILVYFAIGLLLVELIT